MLQDFFSARFRYWLLAMMAGLITSTAHANSPLFGGPFPDGGTRGTELVVGLYGQRLTGIEQVVFYEPGLAVTKLELVNDNLVNATIQIAPDCRMGEHIMRLRTKHGWTGMESFHVGSLPVVGEVEPNSEFEAPQAVALNSTVAGVVKAEDVDYYVVEAKKGQRISAEVEGMRLGTTISVFDPYVAILDSKRFELARSDDTALYKQDGFVSVIAPQDGKYIVMVRETSYGGNDTCRYRLHIGQYPRPTAVFPAGGQPGQTVKFKLIGDPAGPFEQTVTLPNDGSTDYDLFAEKDGKIAQSPMKVRVAAMPDVIEAEPNNDGQTATAHASASPVAFNGILEADGDQDWFKFQAQQGQVLVLRVYARDLGSKLDPVVNVFKADGTHLGGNDDAAGRPDAVHAQQFPETGTYLVRVRDHLDKGGPDYVYRLEVSVPQPKLGLMMPEVGRYQDQDRQFISVPKGNRWVMLVQANRENFAGPLKFSMADLPPGITMHAPVMPANVVFVPVVFEAAADAPIQGKLCDLRAEHTENPVIKGRWTQTVAFRRGDPNQTPYFNSTVERMAVTAAEEAPFKISLVEPKVPLHRDGVMNLRIVAEKKQGWDEPIHVQLPFRPPGLGANPEVVMPKGQNEVYFTINATGNAAEGDWPMVALAYAGVNGGPRYVSSQIVNLKIAPHLVTGQIAMTVTEQGKEATVVVTLNHPTPFDGEARLELIGLPNKCATTPVAVNKDSPQAAFKVTTELQSPIGQHRSLFCQLVIVKNGEEIRQSLAGGGTLRIDKPREPVVAAPAPAAAPKAAAAPATPVAAPEQKKPLSRLEQLRLEQEQRNKK